LKEGEIMLVQDFSKFDYVTHKFQDLIICIYHPDNPRGQYIHFIGSPTEKNDVHFVTHVWKKLEEKGYFNGINKIYLWTDGGPKHFKLTGNINFISEWVDQSGIKVEYHFFASYHGHSVCDSLAAQAKSKADNWIAENNSSIKTAENLAAVINRVNGHSAFSVTGIARNTTETPPCLQAIRSYHKFLFPSPNTVNCYSTSNPDANIQKIHHPRPIADNGTQRAQTPRAQTVCAKCGGRGNQSCTFTMCLSCCRQQEVMCSYTPHKNAPTFLNVEQSTSS
jgi:hypothetical protein